MKTCIICNKIFEKKTSQKKQDKIKYCSRKCSTIAMSLRNSFNNKERNKKVAEIQNNLSLPKLLLAVEEYSLENNTLTLKEISIKHNLPHNSIRKYCVKNNLIRKNLRSIKDAEKIKKTRPFLFDKDFFEKLNKENLTCKEASKIFNISPNTISLYARNINNPIKQKSISTYEKDISSFLNEREVYHEKNKRILNGKEIDIFIPNINVGVEINGCYWHSEKQGKNKNYHLDKHNFAKDKGIELLQFFDYELDKSPDIVKSILINKIGKNDKKIYARKLDLKEIDRNISKEFCIENHLHGYVNSKINIGGYYNNELVVVLCFSKARYDDTEYELTRFCIKKYHTITGSFEKLFNYFVKIYNPNSIVSYCHIRIFSGKQYERVGFVKTHSTPPGYFWYKSKNEMLSRHQTQKHKLNTTLTEKEFMENKGYTKVWDCGQNVYHWRQQ